MAAPAPEELMLRAVANAKMIESSAPLAAERTAPLAQWWRRFGLEESYRLNARVGQRVLNSEDAEEGPKRSPRSVRRFGRGGSDHQIDLKTRRA